MPIIGIPSSSPSATLSPLTRGELRRRVGRFLAIDSDVADWDSSELAAVDDAIQSGLRWFYFPSGERSHEWSFLRKQGVVILATGISWYALPSDFIAMQTPFSLAGSGRAISQIDAGFIRLKTINEGSEGIPKEFGVRARARVDPIRYEAGFYPIPLVSGLAEYWYVFDPGSLSDDNEYPRGGSDHAETIIAACLAAAEKELKPESIGEGGGLQFQMFQAKLAESIARDTKLTQGMGA